jgi:hypothetical protein
MTTTTAPTTTANNDNCCCNINNQQQQRKRQPPHAHPLLDWHLVLVDHVAPGQVEYFRACEKLARDMIGSGIDRYINKMIKAPGPDCQPLPSPIAAPLPAAQQSAQDYTMPLPYCLRFNNLKFEHAHVINASSSLNRTRSASALAAPARQASKPADT